MKHRSQSILAKSRCRPARALCNVVCVTQPGPPVGSDAVLPMGRGDDGCHPRYRCEDHIEYIAGFALPPYIAG